MVYAVRVSLFTSSRPGRLSQQPRSSQPSWLSQSARTSQLSRLSQSSRPQSFKSLDSPIYRISVRKPIALSSGCDLSGGQRYLPFDNWGLVVGVTNGLMPSTAFFLRARAEIKNLLCEHASNAKIWGARAIEHSFKFCEQIEQR